MTKKNPSILAIIAARGGSKGIPNKNIRPLAGKPVIAHTILQAQSLIKKKIISRLIVNTDSPEIATIAKHYHAEIPFLRPHSLAEDRSQVRDVLLHTLIWLKHNENYEPNYLLLLQPTAPLRSESDIIACIKTSHKPNTDAVIGVATTESVSFIEKNGYLKTSPGVPNLKNNTNRQSMSARFIPIGFMFLIKTKVFLKEKTLFPEKTRMTICPNWRAVDLNKPEDLVIAELLLKHQKQIVNQIKNFR